ncbi:hypothetical protein RDV64_07285 [Acuticoccus sp. MNP-M23]|uniref:2-keto-4-pentenoate hydratase n=1 Tax=Acuticoccus sp. MNP-M23 TaxID=3072793 RepID=UPI0028159FA1|nr:hypothetical protein [Acuticoccus sp. MNP-M23]WMS44186.1 hypothetical protein RDV64_07285 [Acuticoccus sp. MNP-M23]
MRFGWLMAAAVMLAPGAALAQTSCGQYDFARPYVGSFLQGETFADAAKAVETITTMADGACHQDEVLALMAAAYGDVVGYKAAATSPGAQKQLGLDGPVLGVLFDGMVLGDGATVPVTDGARMIFELDLLVRVGDPALAKATTRAEALAGIDAFIPFIELGDLMVPKGVPVTGPLLQAMNAGGRLGVRGAPVSTAGMTVASLDDSAGILMKDGAVVAEAPASSLLGHPLDAVLWIAEATRARGMALKTGDLLSLGSMGRFQLASAGKIAAEYTGFGPEPATVSLTLE